jgi:tRNA(Glu) U13 pseudouridine synthase TruD
LGSIPDVIYEEIVSRRLGINLSTLSYAGTLERYGIGCQLLRERDDYV